MLSSRPPKESLRCRLRSRIKKLITVSKKCLDADSNDSADVEYIKTVTFGQRAVLRIRGRVPVASLVSLHKAHKRSSILGSELVAMATERLQLTGSPNPTPEEKFFRNKHQIVQHCAIRCQLEAKLDSLAEALHAIGHIPFRRRAVRVFEEFFQVNPEPNEAEKALLARMAHMGVPYIEDWFAKKRDRLKPLKHIALNQGRIQGLGRHRPSSKRHVSMPMKPLTRH